MIRFVVNLLVIGLMLAVLGGSKIYEAISAGKQQTITYEEFVRRHPTTGWYKITGAAWDLQHGRYEAEASRFDSNLRVYLPVHAARRPPNETTISIIAGIDRPDIQKTARDQTSSETRFLPIPENVAHYNGDIEGTVSVSSPQGSLVKQLRDRLGGKLAPVPSLIAVDKKPNALPGIFLVLGGTGFLAAGVKCAKSSRR
jgi:hypothetical protein